MKAILLFVLSAIILSQGYSFAYADHGGSHTLPAEELGVITIVTDSPSYVAGDMVHVSGYISDYDESDPFKNFDVTLKLVAPNGNIVSISQIAPYVDPIKDEGYYSTYIPAQGPLWKYDGDYTISVSHGSDKNASTTFTFVSILAPEVIEEEEVIEEVEISEEELAEGCGEGTHLEDGVCVLDETTESTSVSTGSVSTGSVPATGMNAWIYSITFTVLIAFTIMIILYVISRASRRKIVN